MSDAICIPLNLPINAAFERSVQQRAAQIRSTRAILAACAEQVERHVGIPVSVFLERFMLMGPAVDGFYPLKECLSRTYVRVDPSAPTFLPSPAEWPSLLPDETLWAQGDPEDADSSGHRGAARLDRLRCLLRHPAWADVVQPIAEAHAITIRMMPLQFFSRPWVRHALSLDRELSHFAPPDESPFDFVERAVRQWAAYRLSARWVGNPWFDHAVSILKNSLPDLPMSDRDRAVLEVLGAPGASYIEGRPLEISAALDRAFVEAALERCT